MKAHVLVSTTSLSGKRTLPISLSTPIFSISCEVFSLRVFRQESRVVSLSQIRLVSREVIVCPSWLLCDFWHSISCRCSAPSAMNTNDKCCIINWDRKYMYISLLKWFLLLFRNLCSQGAFPADMYKFSSVLGIFLRRLRASFHLAFWIGDVD